MKTTHVKDEQIQAYIFDLDHCENAVIEHINSCRQCRTLVHEYQFVSEAVKALPEPHLNFDLADKVLEKIPAAKQNPTLDYTAIGALVVLGLGILAIVFPLVDSGNTGLIKTEHISTFFIVVVVLFTAILWSLDLLKTFHRNMTAIN